MENKNTSNKFRNKTKYFVLHWFDEVCSENNEVNEEAESKRERVLRDSGERDRQT